MTKHVREHHDFISEHIYKHNDFMDKHVYVFMMNL